MKLIEGNIPTRKRKPKETPLDDFEPYTKLRAIMLNRKMAPQQQLGILLDKNDCKVLHMKAPWRTIADRLRKLLSDAGLEKDYEVIRYETSSPGQWFVRVTYSPGRAATHGNKNRLFASVRRETPAS